MTEMERFKIIFDAGQMKRDDIVEYNCEHCGKRVKVRAVVVSKKELLLCQPCGIRYGKSKRTPEQKRITKERTIKTCMEKYGVSNGGGTIDSIRKSKETKIKKHGSLERAGEIALEKRKRTNINLLGVDNYMKLPEFIEKSKNTSIRNFGSLEEAYKARTEKMEKSCMKRWGVKTNLILEENKKKSKETLIRKLGVDHPMKSVEIKQKVVKKFGAIGVVPKGYKYNDTIFDSSYELAYYIHLKENNIDFIYHPLDFNKVYFKGSYYHAYLPDFKIGNVYYELKGGAFFNDDGEPFNRYSKEFWWEKYNFLLEKGVVILREDTIIPIRKGILKKYGKGFFKNLRTL